MYSTTGILFGLVGILMLLYFVPSHLLNPSIWPTDSPPRHPNHYPLIGALRFFYARWDFWDSAGFDVPVVGLRGAKPRQVFFNDRRLNFYDGYNVLYGAAPDNPSQPGKVLKPIEEDPEDTARFDRYIINRFTKLLQKEYYDAALLDMLRYTTEEIESCRHRTDELIDPFKAIYSLIFRHTVRIVCCTEIAEDKAQLETFSAHFERMGTTFGPVGIIAPPWLPTPGRIIRLWSAFGMHRFIAGAADGRRHAGTRHKDGLQMLLDQGDSTDLISRFIISGLFAGQLNTALDCAYLLCYLACNASWLSRVRAEIEGLLARYAPGDKQDFQQRLAKVPFTAWINECPVIDVVLLETIRFVTLGTALRYNESAEPISIGAKQSVPAGAFVAYHLGDVHFDPNVYPDPDRWDPSRYDPAVSGMRPTEEFLGWGRGLHPCPGKALAKLEIGLVLSHFVMLFDFELCDAYGKMRQTVPLPKKNAPVAEKPRVPLRLRIRSRNLKA